MKKNIVNKLKEKTTELKYNLSALYIAYKRKDVSIIAKSIIIIALVYALSPIDLIPDFIPIIGYLDDLIILPLFILLAIKLIPKEILEKCKEEAKELWIDGKPKKWYYGIPIIIIWLMIVIIVIKNILQQRSTYE
ncbi:hypothetical protein PilKf_00352 [Pillotina sp. SPG140]|jgi:uncharacterized membrane protein YkvA (DUF1232 family)